MMTLKDGSKGTIRQGQPDNDAVAMLLLQKALVADGRGMVMVDADLPQTPDGMASRMQDYPGAWLVAEVLRPGEVHLAGSGTLRVLSPGLCKHVGQVAVEVHPSFQGLGLGRSLMDALMEQARKLELVRVELYVRSDNHRALGLYRAMGFKIESTRRKFVRLDDGRYVDDFCMVMFLDE